MFGEPPSIPVWMVFGGYLEGIIPNCLAIFGDPFGEGCPNWSGGGVYSLLETPSWGVLYGPLVA